MRPVTFLMLSLLLSAGGPDFVAVHLPALPPVVQAAKDAASCGVTVTVSDSEDSGRPDGQGKAANLGYNACYEGDGCPHLNHGADVAFIGATNRLEFWIANGELLGGMWMALEIEFDLELAWNMDYGSHPPANEEGRAIDCWNLPDFQAPNDFDNLSPEHVGFSGASMPGTGLPAGPLELCYTFEFVIPASEVEAVAGICVRPYAPCPPGDCWQMIDICHVQFTPDFCGAELYGPGYAPACFDVVYFLNGDADFSGTVNVSDVVRLLAYIFADGLGPNPYESGDVNCDDVVNVTDAVYLLCYIFAGGPVPC